MASLTCNINPLQPTGFRLVIDRKHYPNFQFFANTVTHASMNCDAAMQAVPRIEGIPQAGDKLTFSELSVTMIVDEDLQGYKEIYDWMLRLVNENRVGKTGREADGIPTEADIILQILTSKNNLNKEFRYHDCIPTTLGSIQFLANPGEVEMMFVDVTFRFSYFDLIG